MYVWTVDDVLAIKPNSLASMGYQYFLSYGAPRARAPSARAELRYDTCPKGSIMYWVLLRKVLFEF